jgi:phthalate 4,5-cis-dihydrodiol dehydrogenase
MNDLELADRGPIRLGVIGLGRGFTLMLPALRADTRVALVAAADPDPRARVRFAAEFGARVYESASELCADRDLEAVYVATPHQFHAEHVLAAVARGKHVLVEKPMALSLAQCQAMVDEARRAGVGIVVGHSQSFEAPIGLARQIIASGELGPVRMIHAFNYTDFLYRPRRPEELDTTLGGGVIFNQAPHQVDVVRLLGGGLVQSVRAQTGAWDPRRPTEGAYSALLTFESGCFASLTYSGFAHFDSDQWCGYIGESGESKDPARYGDSRRELSAAGQAEVSLRQARGYGSGASQSETSRRLHGHFGLLIISCDRGDLCPEPDGVTIHGDTTRRKVALAPPTIPRVQVLDALYYLVRHGHQPVQSGEWGLATMEVCLAILQSARQGCEVVLRHQVAVPS